MSYDPTDEDLALIETHIETMLLAAHDALIRDGGSWGRFFVAQELSDLRKQLATDRRTAPVAPGIVRVVRGWLAEEGPDAIGRSFAVTGPDREAYIRCMLQESSWYLLARWRALVGLNPPSDPTHPNFFHDLSPLGRLHRDGPWTATPIRPVSDMVP